MLHNFFANESMIATFLIAFVVSYLYCGIGITLGYHRLLTHKSLKLPKWLEYFIVFGGYLTLMGSPVIWVAVHRLHHLKSDQPGDPHSPRDGFTHALYKWMFDPSYQSNEEVKRVCADLLDDPVYKILGHEHTGYHATLCLWVNIAARVVMFVVAGPVVVVANLLATTMVFWSTQFVNTFCHMKEHGYRTFETREDSRNVWWVGLLACGEGWHNNHHAMPKSARHGMEAHEFDICWITIWVLEKLGLAKSVVRPNPAVRAAKLKKADVHANMLYIGKTAPGHVPIAEEYNETQLVGVIPANKN